MCPHESDVAPYLLGALPDGDVTVFEHHLYACSACRADVEGLSAVRQALLAPEPIREETPSRATSRRMRSAIVGQAEGQSELFGQLTPKRSHPRRRQLAYGLASLMLAFVAWTGSVRYHAPDDTRLYADSTAFAASSEASLREHEGEFTLDVAKAPDLPSGYTYRVWGQRATGDIVFLGDLAMSKGEGKLAIPVDGWRKVMVTREPSQLSKKSTGPLIWSVAMPTSA